MPELDGRIALVTGGSRGIGARRSRSSWPRAGARVAVNYAAQRRRGRTRSCERIKAAGGTPCALQGDVADPSRRRRWSSNRGGGDRRRSPTLVNNAGITRDDLIMRLGDDDWRDVIDTNLGGTFFTLPGGRRKMLKRRRGSIVNMSLDRRRARQRRADQLRGLEGGR